MEPRDFCYWLQGLLEAGKVVTLDADQVQMVREHLQTVFVKVTPPTQTKQEVSDGTLDKLKKRMIEQYEKDSKLIC
jgi:hypothetical protein